MDRHIVGGRLGTVLDLFCGGGGAGKGYHDAGFNVIGIDSVNHENSYGTVGEFYQVDWEDGLRKYAGSADFIHASPPCQAYSQLTRWGRKENISEHPDFIGPLRRVLESAGKPYVIENVVGAPLNNAIMLCGWTFGYSHYRHRLFEGGGGIVFAEPPHRRHEISGRNPGHKMCGKFHSVCGHMDSVSLAREVMDINWLPGETLAEAIPPYYSFYLALQVHDYLGTIIGIDPLEYVRVMQLKPPGPESRQCVWGRPVYLKRLESPDKGGEKWREECVADWTPCKNCPLTKKEDNDGYRI